MLQNLVPDREICQEAKDKGVVIESSFYWTELNVEWFIIDVLDGYSIPKGDEHRFVSAPLTDEILKVLPQQFGGQDLEIVKLPHDIYSCGYPRDIMGRGINYYQDKKLSNALLLLYMKLKEENLL